MRVPRVLHPRPASHGWEGRPAGGIQDHTSPLGLGWRTPTPPGPGQAHGRAKQVRGRRQGAVGSAANRGVPEPHTATRTPSFGALWVRRSSNCEFSCEISKTLTVGDSFKHFENMSEEEQERSRAA